MRGIYLVVCFFLISCGANGVHPTNQSSTSTGLGSYTGTDTGTGTSENGSIAPPPAGSDGGFIAFYKPALAIRATGCIMCHANVASAVITDFGYGNNYFFGANAGSNITPFSGAIYGNHASNYASAAITGNIYVPQAPVQYTSNGTQVNTTLAQYLSGVVTAPSGGVKPTVVENRVMYIGAPTTAQLLTAAGAFPSNHPQWKHMGSTDVSGLQLSSSGQYVENIPNSQLNCVGDLVVNDVLFLNNVHLNTTAQGCRIYATSTVFIQGPITFVDSDPDHNIQITSSKAIMLGFGNGPIYNSVISTTTPVSNNSIQYRFQGFWTDPGFFTRDTSLTTQQKLDSIVNDGALIPNLTDAYSQTPLGRAVAFSHILLNAPNVQSRYQGEFDGVIIAEMAMGSLSQFKFMFDDVFTRAPILPLIKESVMLQLGN